MTYTIKVVLWTDVEGLELVESSVWHYANGGTWDLTHGKGSGTTSPSYTLTMSGSGTSGMLRFKAPSGELCAVAVGIHNWAPWSGGAVDLTPGEQSIVLLMRALVGRPPLVLLDEVWSGMDEGMVKAVWRYLADGGGGLLPTQACVVISHWEDEVPWTKADGVRRMLLKDGVAQEVDP